MGIIWAFFGLAGILLAIFGIALCGGLVFLVVRLVIKRSIIRILVWFPTTLLLCVAGWFYLNANELQDQRLMDQVSKDCGWKEYKTVNDVDGIYLDVPPANVYSIRSLL